MTGELPIAPQLFLDPIGDARDRLRRLIASIQDGRPLAPVTVVGPSNYANLSLRHVFGRHGMANVRFMVMPRLAELLGAPVLAASGRLPLTPLLESAAVRAVAERASGPVAPLSGHPAMLHSLRRTFHQVRHATPEALNRLESTDPLRREVVRLFRNFSWQRQHYYDREDLAIAAATTVMDGKASALRDLGTIMFFLPREFTSGERDMVRAIATNDRRCAIIFGLTGDGEADAPVPAQAQHLGGVFAYTAAPAPLPWAGTGTRPYGELSTPAPSVSVPPIQHPVPSTQQPPAQSLRLLVAPDPQQEVRWAIRHMLKTAAADATPFHRMAILFPRPDHYAGVVRDELEMAGIAASGPGAVRLSETATGRAITGMLRLVGSELPRDEVTAWLTGCPVKAPAIAASAFNPTRWDATSRRAGVVAGATQWETRLGHYASELESSAARGIEVGEMSEASAERMRSEARSARALAAFIATLVTDLSPPAVTLSAGRSADISPIERETKPGGARTWAGLARWLAGLIERYVSSGGSAPEHEIKARQRIVESLKEFEGLSTVDPKPTLAKFMLAFEEALSAPAGHTGQTGHGIFVASIGAAIGMEFDLVHIVGMVEGAIPARTKDDPLLPDRDRTNAGGPAAGLPLLRDDAADERYRYLAALKSGTRSVLSYAVANPASQCVQFPSRWLLEAACRLEGVPVYNTDIPSLRGRPWMTILSSAEDALRSVPDEAAFDRHDYQVERLWQWRESGRPVSEHPIASTGVLTRAMTMERRRRSRALSEWDGDVSDLKATASRLDPTARRVLSPTSLETWAKCPYRYFLSRVLGVGALERPEEVTSISPLEKGQLVHGVLEKFISSTKQSADGPRPGKRWEERHRQALRDMAQDAFHDAEGRGVTGKRLLWSLVRDDILNDLTTFLEEDDQYRERFRVSPYALEAAFGGDSRSGGVEWPPVSFDLPGGGVVRFRGFIDRVDMDENGSTAIVLDYKTGSTYPYYAMKDDPVDRGKRLQLPVYALALRSVLGPGVRVKAAYWFVSAGGKFAFIPSEPIDIERLLPSFKTTVTTIVGGIREGLFPANPGEVTQTGFENCTFCEFTSVCQSRRDISWQRKQSDPRLKPYVDLAVPVS